LLALAEIVEPSQVDGCTNVTFAVSKKANYCQMIWADSHALLVMFGDADDTISTGLDSLDAVGGVPFDCFAVFALSERHCVQMSSCV